MKYFASRLTPKKIKHLAADVEVVIDRQTSLENIEALAHSKITKVILRDVTPTQLEVIPDNIKIFIITSATSPTVVRFIPIDKWVAVGKLSNVKTKEELQSLISALQVQNVIIYFKTGRDCIKLLKENRNIETILLDYTEFTAKRLEYIAEILPGFKPVTNSAMRNLFATAGMHTPLMMDLTPEKVALEESAPLINNDALCMEISERNIAQNVMLEDQRVEFEKEKHALAQEAYQSKRVAEEAIENLKQAQIQNMLAEFKAEKQALADEADQSKQAAEEAILNLKQAQTQMQNMLALFEVEKQTLLDKVENHKQEAEIARQTLEQAQDEYAGQEIKLTDQLAEARLELQVMVDALLNTKALNTELKEKIMQKRAQLERLKSTGKVESAQQKREQELQMAQLAYLQLTMRQKQVADDYEKLERITKERDSLKEKVGLLKNKLKELQGSEIERSPSPPAPSATEKSRESLLPNLKRNRITLFTDNERSDPEANKSQRIVIASAAVKGD